MNLTVLFAHPTTAHTRARVLRGPLRPWAHFPPRITAAAMPETLHVLSKRCSAAKSRWLMPSPKQWNPILAAHAHGAASPFYLVSLS
jgi:hypothetical protein